MEDRFWNKVQKSEGCWNWLAALQPTGYGAFMLSGRTRVAHRIAYELVKGPIPDGLTLDHLCRNRRCVNPDHLEPVTRGENVLRGIGFAAINSRKTHCPNGHELFGENLHIKTDRSRRCKTCHRESAVRYRLRKSLAA